MITKFYFSAFTKLSFFDNFILSKLKQRGVCDVRLQAQSRCYY